MAKGYDWGGFLETDPLDGQPPLSPSLFARQLLAVDSASGALSLIGAEGALGNPLVDGYLLSSTAAGVRSWIAPSSGSSLPTQSGHSGGLLTTDGSAASWLTTTSFGRGFLPLADAAAARNYLGASSLGSSMLTFSTLGTLTIPTFGVDGAIHAETADNFRIVIGAGTASLTGGTTGHIITASGATTIADSGVALSSLAPQRVVDVKAYGAVGDGVAVETTAINNAIAAIPAAGGVLYFPQGKYKTAGNHSLSKPITVQGDGASTGEITDVAVTQIECTSATNSAFTVSTNGCSFKDFSLKNTSGSTPSAGAGITVTTGGDLARYENLKVWGFYINMDLRAGQQWSIDHCYFIGPVLYGLKWSHVAIPDGGDSSITNSTIIAYGQDATAGIRVESGGGVKINNIKINGANTTGDFFTHGIDIAIPASTSTVDFLVCNSSIENFTGNGINLTTTGASSGWNDLIFNGVQISANVGSGNAIHIAPGVLNTVNKVIITNCPFDGSGSAAISLTNVNQAVISNCLKGGFTNLTSKTNCTNVTEVGTDDGGYYVATSSGFMGIYKTDPDASNYERFSIGYSSYWSAYFAGSDPFGTGVERKMHLSGAGIDFYNGLTLLGAISSTGALSVTDPATTRTNLGLTIGTNVQAYDPDLTTWAAITRGTGFDAAAAINVGSAGAVVVNGGALGTPSSGVATNLTSIPAGNLTGSIADARLSANVPLKDAANVFSALNTFTSLKLSSGLIYPSSDSTTAIRIMKADGTTAVGTWDTTNSFLGINGTPVYSPLEIRRNGNIAYKGFINLVDTAHASNSASNGASFSGFGSDIGANNTGRVWYFGPDGASLQLDLIYQQNGPIVFYTNATEAARFNADQSTTLAGNITVSGGTITGGASGLSLAAGGTNQNITLTPSGTGKVVFATRVNQKAYTVSTLPTGAAGDEAYVTDGDASLAWGATVVNSGGGATKYLVWFNGSNWTVVGK